MSMNLSAELLIQIVTSLKSDGTSSFGGHEKRRDARVGLRCGLDVAPRAFSDLGNKPQPVFVHDLSREGIGFVSSIKLPTDLEFVANFQRQGHPSVPVLYKVTHHRSLSRQLHAGGAKLVRVLPDADGETVQLGRSPKPPKAKVEAPAVIETPTPAVAVG